MSILTALLMAVLTASLLQGGLWLHARKSRNAGWVDLGWSLGMAIGAGWLAFASPFSLRAWAVSLLVLGWGARLAWHIYSDRLRGGCPEDARYAALRAHWGKSVNLKFFFFFQAQALLVGLFLLPAAVVSNRPGHFPDRWDWLGVIIAFVAVIGESVADHQLARFRADPANRGQVCAHGLWRYSRHPNYFFEWLHWFAYVSMSVGASDWALTLLGPIAMYIFLRYLTGIPHVERQSLKSRGEAYRTYQRTTPIFFPWIPRKP